MAMGTCSRCLDKYDKSIMKRYETLNIFYLCQVCNEYIYGK